MNARSIIVVAATACTVFWCGCGMSPELREELKDPDKSLQVTVRSIPSGAEVYGIKRGKPGTLLGTTPMICSYLLLRSGDSPEIMGNVPVGETIVTDMELRSSARGSSEYSFQCVVTLEGYQTAVVKKVLRDDAKMDLRNFSTSDVFKGGRAIDILVELPPMPTDSAGIE